MDATYKRVVDNSPAYMNVNEVTLPFGSAAEESLHQWIWERIGPFPNQEIIRITIARPYNENLKTYMALFMDSFVFTDNPFFHPESNRTESMPPPHVPLTRPASGGSFQPNLPSGKYTCRVQAQSEANIVDAFGRLPVASNRVEVSVP